MSENVISEKTHSSGVTERVVEGKNGPTESVSAIPRHALRKKPTSELTNVVQVTGSLSEVFNTWV